MRLLLDMNLSPAWQEVLSAAGWEVRHWVSGPSVVQIRGQDVTSSAIGSTLTSILQRYAESLERGAILTVDLPRSRIRLLPLN